MTIQNLKDFLKITYPIQLKRENIDMDIQERNRAIISDFIDRYDQYTEINKIK